MGQAGIKGLGSRPRSHLSLACFRRHLLLTPPKMGVLLAHQVIRYRAVASKQTPPRLTSRYPSLPANTIPGHEACNLASQALAVILGWGRYREASKGQHCSP